MKATPNLIFSGAVNNYNVPLIQSDTQQYKYQMLVGSQDGQISVQLSGKDLAGNNVTSQPTSGDNFTLDNTLPTGNLVISSPAGAQQGYTNSPNVSIQLTAEDSFNVTHYAIHLDNVSTPLETQFISIGSHQVFNHSILLSILVRLKEPELFMHGQRIQQETLAVLLPIRSP